MRHSLLMLGLFCLLSCDHAKSMSQAKAEDTMSCDQIRTTLDRFLKPNESVCQKDEDCLCFNAGLTNSHPCGGVTNTKQFEQAKGRREQFEAQNCGYTIDCVAWECKPTCEKGLCETNGKY